MPTEVKETTTWPRVLGHLPGPATGPVFIGIGGLHGNESAGVLALRQVFTRLEAKASLLRGTFLALSGNRAALEQGVRFLDEDLNRSWYQDRLAALRRGEAPRNREEEEMRALDLELRAVIEGADSEAIFLIDFHTTSAPGPAFSILNDSLPNRAFALSLPVPTVLGLEEEVSGTLPSYLARSYELRSIGFESGQHHDPEAVDVAAAAIWLALAESGVIDEAAWPEVTAGRERLELGAAGLPHIVDVQYRHGIDAEDGFRMRTGYRGFQPVDGGDVLGDDVRGEVRAPFEGLLLMPLYQGQGQDGFFVVRSIQPFWLRLSAALRRLRLGQRLHWLPGIHRHPTIEHALIVDRRWARVLVVEFFHLMGFWRRGPAEGRFVTMCRRAFDRWPGG